MSDSAPPPSPIITRLRRRIAVSIIERFLRAVDSVRVREMILRYAPRETDSAKILLVLN